MSHAYKGGQPTMSHAYKGGQTQTIAIASRL